jgi:hypothetical protein
MSIKSLSNGKNVLNMNVKGITRNMVLTDQEVQVLMALTATERAHECDRLYHASEPRNQGGVPGKVIQKGQHHPDFRAKVLKDRLARKLQRAAQGDLTSPAP